MNDSGGKTKQPRVIHDAEMKGGTPPSIELLYTEIVGAGTWLPVRLKNSGAFRNPIDIPTPGHAPQASFIPVRETAVSTTSSTASPRKLVPGVE